MPSKVRSFIESARTVNTITDKITADSKVNADLLENHPSSYFAPVASPTFTGTVSGSTLKTNAAQIGQSATATNNFTLYQPASPDGTIRLGQGNADNASDILVLDGTSTTKRLINIGELYIPHTGVTGGPNRNSIRSLRWGSYGRLQHTSYQNVPALTFNAELFDSDFVGSASGTVTNTNTYKPDYAAGVYSIMSQANGGFAFNTGRWNNAASIEIGLFTGHASYAGGVTPDGYWTKPKQPAFKVSTNGASPTTAAGSVIPFRDKTSKRSFDNTGSFNTSTYRFTAPIDGKYFFAINMLIDQTASVGNYAVIGWRVNGANVHTQWGSTNAPSYYVQVSGSIALNLSANDYVDIVSDRTIYTGSSGDHTFFMGWLIG